MPEIDYVDESAPVQQTFDPLPANKYKAMITASDIVATKAGTGQMIKFTWTVIEGEYQGRLIFDTINFRNVSEKAQQIGQSMLASLRAATACRGKNTEDYHNIPVMVKVAIRPAEGKYGPANVVKGYEPVNGSKQGPHALPPTTANAPILIVATPVNPAEPRKFPWKK